MKKLKSFTLIEVLVYLVLFSAISMMMSGFFVKSLEAKIKAQTIGEVEQQGSLIIEEFNRVVHNANAINSVSANSASFQFASAPLNPTVISFNTNKISEVEGAQASVDLNSTRVDVSNFSFQNLSYPATAGAVRINFTLTYHNNVSGRYEYTYSKDFKSTASLRKK